MTPPEKTLLVAGSFLAGVGAMVAVAFALDELERRREAVLQRAGRAEAAGEANRQRAREGENHVRALLRQPCVSKSDHQTDRTAAEMWLHQRDPGQSS